MSGPSATTVISPTSLRCRTRSPRRVTIAIAPAIADAEQQRALHKPPDRLTPGRPYQRGLWHVSRWTAEDHALAEKFFQQAVELDPNFAGGYKGLAVVLGSAADFQRRSLPEAVSSAEALARRAVRARRHRCRRPLLAQLRTPEARRL